MNYVRTRCPNCGSTNTKEREGTIPTTIDCMACKIYFCLTLRGVWAHPDQPNLNAEFREKMRAKDRAFKQHLDKAQCQS